MNDGADNWPCKFEIYRLPRIYSNFNSNNRRQAIQKQSDYAFFIDADTHIDDNQVLRELLILNRYIFMNL